MIAPSAGPPRAKPTTPPRIPAVNSTVSSLMGTMAPDLIAGAAGSSDMKRVDRGRVKGAGAKAEAEPTRARVAMRLVYLTMVERA